MTNELRKVIYSLLTSTITTAPVFYGTADDESMFPHVVFTLESTDYGYLDRHDYRVEIDVWTKDDIYNAEAMADSIIAALNADLAQDTDLLVAFFIDDRKELPDEDKSISHIRIKSIAQTHERS